MANEGPLKSATGFPLSGRVFSDFYLPVHNPHDTSFPEISTSLWLQGDPKLSEDSSARFVFTGDRIESSIGAGTGSASSAQFKADLREGYVDFNRSGWEFRLGRQINPWGKSDVINPTDFLGAKDYTFFNPDDEVRRIGSSSLWLNWTPAAGISPFNFTVVWTPVFPQSKNLFGPGVVPAGVTLEASPASPPTTLTNSEVAVKASYTAPSWDASFIAFRGFRHTPELTVKTLPASPITGGLALGQGFHRLRALGSDFSIVAAQWILRTENAYGWTDNDDGRNPLIEPSYWDSVTGVERPIGDDFRIQVQFFWRYFPQYTPPEQAGGPDPVSAAVFPQIARSNALLLGYQDKSRTGCTFRYSYVHEGSGIEAELFSIFNFVGSDYLLRPKASYGWTDSLKTTLGIDYYSGPDNRPLGALKPYSAVFTEAKYSF